MNYTLNHLKELEAESIFVFREAAAQFQNPVMLFSGGKDSVYSAWLAKNSGHEIVCLISVFSENKESFMFHTPSIKQVQKQAKVMDIPLVIGKTKGEKEKLRKENIIPIRKEIRAKTNHEKI